jgi:hypothetical protein
MKPSTERALTHAQRLVEAAGDKLSPAGFKYHSERTWLGMTMGGDVIAVFVFPEPDKLPVVAIHRNEYKENYVDPAAKAPEPEKKSVKKPKK